VTSPTSLSSSGRSSERRCRTGSRNVLRNYI
jgi:hypothetical protein